MREIPRHQRARLGLELGRAVPYMPELETLGERYGIRRASGETPTVYGRRVIAAIDAAHDRSVALAARLERDLNLAFEFVGDIPPEQHP